MYRVCAWCKRFLGFRAPLSDPDVTHGICRACSERVLRENEGARCQTLIIVQHSRRDLLMYLERVFAGVPGVSVRMDRRAGERRWGAFYTGSNRRQLERRRAVYAAQLSAWETLGVFVVRRRAHVVATD